MSDEPTLLHLRLCQLAEARGDVPDEGGVDGVWTDEFPDVDTDEQWFVALNADDEEREYRLTEDRKVTIAPYHGHVWYDRDHVVPAAMSRPTGGETMVTHEFSRSTEDQVIASIEAVLEASDYDDFEVVVLDG